MNHTINKTISRAAFVLLLSAGLATSAAIAQTPDNPPPPADQTQGPPPHGPGGPRGDWRGGPERRVEMLQKRLNLSEDQTAQVKAVFADSRSKMEALRQSSQNTPPDPQAMRQIHEQEEARLEAIFTPDQKAKYEQMRERQREHMQDRRQGPPPDGSAPPPPPPPPPAL